MSRQTPPQWTRAVIYLLCIYNPYAFASSSARVGSLCIQKPIAMKKYDISSSAPFNQLPVPSCSTNTIHTTIMHFTTHTIRSSTKPRGKLYPALLLIRYVIVRNVRGMFQHVAENDAERLRLRYKVAMLVVLHSSSMHTQLCSNAR
jgi:hypothetical protein